MAATTTTRKPSRATAGKAGQKRNDTRRHVVITGVTSGIGSELARLFAAENTRLLGTGRKPEDEVGPLVEGKPANVAYMQADQCLPDCAGTIRRTLSRRRWPRIDNLVLNAAIGRVGDPADETPADIEAVMTANLLAPILILRTLFPLLAEGERAERALVTLIGSTARRGAPDFASYAASKAGLGGLARSLASEWRGRIDVQLIDPGPTATGMHAKAGLEPGFANRFFVDPHRSAERIRQLIASRKPQAKVTIGPAELMAGLSGRREASP